MFLADGAYLEPLSVADSAAASRAIREGNVFVARDRLYRDRVGEDGMTAIVLSTHNAAADDERFRQHGLSAGPILDFSRAFVDPEGRSAMASFRLAFASDATSTSFAFACQRINPPPSDRTALEEHANGVTGLAGVVAVSEDPEASASFLAAVSEARAVMPGADRASVGLGNAVVDVLTPYAYLSRYGRPAPSGAGLRYAAVRFRVADRPAIKAVLERARVAFDNTDGCVLVPAAPGQGVDFLFGD